MKKILESDKEDILLDELTGNKFLYNKSTKEYTLTDRGKIPITIDLVKEIVKSKNYIECDKATLKYQDMHCTSMFDEITVIFMYDHQLYKAVYDEMKRFELVKVKPVNKVVYVEVR